MKVTFLGTGTSLGVPVVGCRCGVCTSDDPKNRRTRSSIYVETDQTRLLIDTATELRLQLLREGIDRVDFILFTHAHADHVLGLDDVRPLNSLMDGAIDCFAKPDVLERIREKFDYVFEDTANDSWKPNITLNPMESAREINGLNVIPLPVMHGNLPIYGYRIGPLAYINDVSHIPPGTMDKLGNLEVLVLDALRQRPHPTHFHLDEAVENARSIGARRTYFTHLTHDMEHGRVNASLPENMQLAYDGLRLDIDAEP